MSSRGYHASTSQKDFLKKRYNSPLLSKATSRIYSKEVIMMLMMDMEQMMTMNNMVQIIRELTCSVQCSGP